MINLEQYPEFKECTEKEQNFLRVYLDTENDAYLNIETATKAAFDISQSNALAYGRALLSRPRIKKLVELCNVTALPTLEDFKRKLWQTIDQPQKDSRITLGALSLYAEISGWKKQSAKKSADDDESFSALNDIAYKEPNASPVGNKQEDDQS